MTLPALLFVLSAGCLLGVVCFVGGAAWGVKREWEAEGTQWKNYRDAKTRGKGNAA